MSETLQNTLLKSGLVDESALNIALQIQEQTREDLVSILLERENIPDEKILPVLEEAYQMPAIDLDSYDISPEVLEIIPEQAARDFMVLPLYLLGDTLTVAISDPLNFEAAEYLRALTNKEIQFLLSTKRAILRGINRYYISKEAIHQSLKELAEKETKDEDRSAPVELEIKEEDAPVVKLVNYIISSGIDLQATDIHLEPLENRISLRYRIDGVLHEFPPPPFTFYKAVVSRMKILSRLDVTEKRLPQDGRMTLKFENRTVDMRVSIIPFIYGEGICIRILDQGARSLDLEDLGFEPDELAKFNKLILNPNGMLLVTGPTGSGKTTTLYSAIKVLYSPTHKIITIEDPVESRIDGIMQIQVQSEIKYSFAQGLRFILRHDPDIIMVGEIRDRESADIAVRAALTGHLLLSTLHTIDSASAVDRLCDIGIESFLVQATLRGVIAQRLIRKLCLRCKEKAKPTPSQIEHLNLDYDLAQRDFFVPVGCGECRNLGYRGRTAIFELLVIDQLLRDLPSREFTTNNIRRLLKQTGGHRTLRQNAIVKAVQGFTSLEEVQTLTAE